MPLTYTHIFHVVLDSVLLEVSRCLCSIEPLCRIHISLFKVVPVDLQFVIRVGAQVHCWQKHEVSSYIHVYKN